VASEDSGVRRSLPPEPRRAVRRGLKGLQRECGDIRALEGPLENFYRLRVLKYRIIFYYEVSDHEMHSVYLCCASDIIYEVFAPRLRDFMEDAT
jgi:hypothetical protein